jgi:Abnormal spindle-like microcephaly-assoc'd, ASPM-SPD-2-Hydin
VKDFDVLSKAVAVLLALATMLGCQGLDANRSATTLSKGLVVADSHLDFGTVVVGHSEILTNTIVNTAFSPMTIEHAAIDKPEFALVGQKLPLTLGPGQRINLNIAYKPRARGISAGTVVLASNRLVTSTGSSLSGAAVSPGRLTVSPSSMSFGNVPIGQSHSQPATLSNSGGSRLTINQVTVSGTGFSVRGLSLPLTLVPGQNVMITVTFTPSSSGSTSGTVSLLLTSGGHRRKGNSSISTFSSVSTSLSLPVSGAGITTGQLVAAPFSLSFGSVQVGATQTASAALANTSNTAVTVSQATITGAGFSLSGLSLPLTLSAGQSTNFIVTFAPKTGGSANGSVSIVSNAANSSLTLALSGNGATPGTVAATSMSLSFGSVQIGSSTTRSEILTNSGGSSVTVTQANVTGSGFSVTGLNLPMVLSPGQSFTFGVAFAPTSAGSTSGSISVVSDASNPNLTIALAGSGTAAGQLSVSPGTLSFGTVIVGQSTSLTATMSASGSSVTVSSGTASTSEFRLSGVSFPITLAADQSAPVTITFAPQASGTASASVSFVSSASNSPVSASLTGTGAAPPQHSVSLSWNASTSSVVGYHVYRGSVTGGPYTEIDSVLNASTNYVDNSVQAGQTYYYVATAVDGSGVESGYSNQVKAAIPTP